MKNTLQNSFVATTAILRSSCASLAVLLLAGTFASTAHAIVIGNYSFMIGESDRYLKAILDFNRGDIDEDELDYIRQEETCKSPSIRLQQRNRPAILIQNVSAQENDISTFVIDLKEAGFEFGLGDKPSQGYNGTPVALTGRSDPGVEVTGSLDMTNTILTLNFTGLNSDSANAANPSLNNAAIFRIDLDPSPMINFLYPDFREVLLGADAGNGSTDKAMVQAIFSMAGMPDAPTPFISLNGPDTITDAGLLQVYHAQSMTTMFGTDGGTDIPEPATASLLGVALLAPLLGRKRIACRG